MESIAAKIRINMSQAEIEIEGSEEFVEKHIKKMGDYFQLCETIIPAKSAAKASHSSEDPSSNQLKNGDECDKQLPSTFGEWINKAPSNATDSVNVIFAGFYNQKHSEGNCFNSSSVNQLLKDHGIKVANVSTTIKRILEAKKIFQVGKVEGLINYRLTRESEQEIINTICG